MTGAGETAPGAQLAGLVLSSDERAADEAAVGGKAANLARLTGAGLQVPPYFAVGTEAFQAFLSSYRDDPRSTLLRLQLDSLPRSLGGAQVIFQLGDVEVVDLPPSTLDEEQ